MLWNVKSKPVIIIAKSDAQYYNISCRENYKSMYINMLDTARETCNKLGHFQNGRDPEKLITGI